MSHGRSINIDHPILEFLAFRCASFLLWGIFTALAFIDILLYFIETFIKVNSSTAIIAAVSRFMYKIINANKIKLELKLIKLNEIIPTWTIEHETFSHYQELS